MKATEIEDSDIDNERYIRYLKDKEAIRFINLARALNEQNADIHNWFAREFLGEIFDSCIEKKTYHHYGMPTDYSIAIGTYVVDTDDIVPIFSRKGYPICMFRPNDNMWGVILGNKVKHLVPHGWGQCVNISDKGASDILLRVVNGYIEAIKDEKILFHCPIKPGIRFTEEQVFVRNLISSKERIDEKDFQVIGENYLDGEIIDILDPLAEFSKDEYLKEKGTVSYYYDPNKEKDIFL